MARSHNLALFAAAASLAHAAPQLPAVPFELELGPDAPVVAFRVPLQQGSAFVTGNGEIVYALAARGGGGWSLVESFVGGEVRPVGIDETVARVSRFRGGDPTRWTSDAPTFERLELGEVWPGVRVELAARASSVEKVFTLEPHAAAGVIRIRLDGACSLRVETDGALRGRADGALRGDDDGSLEVSTPEGEVAFSAPIAWQMRDGVRERVEVAYTLAGSELGFRVGAHDEARELWIDPILQSTYLGGTDATGAESARSIVFDAASASLYAAGRTMVADFPGTAGGAIAAAPAGGFNFDVFVAKVSADLKTLQRATYYGGNSDDSFDAFSPPLAAVAIAVGSGGVYVCGATRSSNLPGVATGADSTLSGAQDGFVARFNADLTSLLGATYHGCVEAAGDQDLADDIAIDSVSGDVFVVGTVAGVMSGTAGAAQATPAGARDAYVSRLSGTLATLVRTSYVGSSNCIELGRAVALAGSTVYVAGFADLDVAHPTNPSDLLVLTAGTAGAAQPLAAREDGFIVSLDTALTTFTGGTFFGGVGIEVIEDLALGGSGDVYVTGVTSSNSLPGSAGGAQPNKASFDDDAFVARFSGGLGALLGSTYMGGQQGEWGFGLGVNPTNGDVYATGFSVTTNAVDDFPALAGGAQPVSRGAYSECYVARLSPTLASFVQSTFLGGQFDDLGIAIAFDPGGDVYVGGRTSASDFPATAGGADSTFAGGSEGFVTRFDAALSFGAPVTYCQGGLTSNGCRASITASANPSATFATPCMLTCASVEGQKTGILFYGINGPAYSQWCAGGSSYLCVKSPSQRMGVQGSGGTAGLCNGTLSIDWNLYRLAHPTALGSPFTPGNVVCAQAWFRDPLACKTTNLSNAVYMAVQP